MKKCKYCQTEIDSKAKICPNCHKKQTHSLLRILIGIILIFVGIAIISGTKEDNFQKDYSQSEFVNYKDVVYSITSVTKTKGSNEFFQAKDGYEYVKVTVKIENNSSEKISYNALNFQMVNGDGVEASFYSITAEDDVLLSSGELDAGGVIEGTIIWEQKEGDNNLRVRYYENVLLNSDYTFQWTIE